MIVRHLAVPLLALGLGAAFSSAGLPADPPPILNAPPPKIGATECVLSGTVTEVGSDSITIQPGESKESVFRFNERGERVEVVTRLTPPRPPIKLPLGKALATGERPMPPPHSYGLKDVKVGDRVTIEISHANEIASCQAICIKRRPGGLIPPAPGDKMKIAWHERCQAEQDFEEKGTPIPEKFKASNPHKPTDPGDLIPAPLPIGK